MMNGEVTGLVACVLANVWPDVPTSLMSIFREPLTPLLVPKYLAKFRHASAGYHTTFVLHRSLLHSRSLLHRW